MTMLFVGMLVGLIVGPMLRDSYVGRKIYLRCKRLNEESQKKLDNAQQIDEAMKVLVTILDLRFPGWKTGEYVYQGDVDK